MVKQRLAAFDRRPEEIPRLLESESRRLTTFQAAVEKAAEQDNLPVLLSDVKTPISEYVSNEWFYEVDNSPQLLICPGY